MAASTSSTRLPASCAARPESGRSPCTPVRWRRGYRRTPPMSDLLELRGLTKHIRDHWTMRRTCILDGVDLAIHEGELFGLIGHNGAGKTTTFKLVLGFLRPSAGSVQFAGRELGTQARRH